LKNAILELFVEEIPASLINPAINHMKVTAEQGLAEHQVEHGDLCVYSSPRRLVVYIQNLAPQTQDKKEEFTGPPVTVAYDGQGNPTKAAIGFAANHGVDASKLVIKETPKGKYVTVVKHTAGIATEKILPLVFLNIINKLNFPKSMVWEPTKFRFIRPIRNILALYDGKHVKFTVAGKKSVNYTYGLFALSDKKIKVSAPEKYFTLLKNNNVIIDQGTRRELIVKLVADTAKRLKCKVADTKNGFDAGQLIDEINNLVEHPTVIVGEFDEKYLALPDAVLMTCMKAKQKFIPLVNDQGKLINKFIGIRNGISEYQDIVKEGYERVLAARLNDAEFFFNQDTKKKLGDYVEKLNGVTFHEKLGSVYAKVQRTNKLASYIFEIIAKQSSLNTQQVTVEDVQRTVDLSKADLVTEMVGEYPELQGVVGKIYALRAGEKEIVAKGIEEHYWPTGASGTPGGKLPETVTGIITSLADKIDTIVNDFSIGLIPTGSGDPFGLRRQTLGIIRILIEHNIGLSLKPVLEQCCEISGIDNDRRIKTINDVMDFVYQRLEGILVDKGNKLDEIRSVLAKRTDNIVDMESQVSAVHEIRTQATEFEPLAAGYKRAANILKQAYAKGYIKKDDPATGYDAALVEPEEKELYSQISRMKTEVEQLTKDKKYIDVLRKLVTLRPYIDNFFEKILVIAQDETLRNSRLLLLKDVTGLFSQFVDFTHIGTI
jgi:glycyl-tRNA synthetase beta chain